MKTPVHLTVLDAEGVSQAEAIVNPARHHVAWGTNFNSFRVLPLRWVDDGTYAAWQAEDWAAEED